MDDRRIRAAADQLLDMRRTRTVVSDLPTDLRPVTLVEAYAVQDLVVAGLLRDGGRRIGYKVACTSRLAQTALGIDGPLFGQLLSHTSSSSGATLRSDEFVHRVVEAEFAFRIGTDVHALTGGHDEESIAGHVAAVLPAVEIVDYRYESWAVGALPVAADNAIHGWWVRGDPVSHWRELDLAATEVEVRRNGASVAGGSGAAVLGHPLTVVAWLADELLARDRRLSAGDVVTTGVTTDVFEAEAGDRIVAGFAGIGDVTLGFD